MDQAHPLVRSMVIEGAKLSQIVERLREDDSFVLTPFNFLHVFQTAVGMRLSEGYRLLECFDADMQPRVALTALDERGDEVLARYRTPQSR